jgi:hypothetical protein
MSSIKSRVHGCPFTVSVSTAFQVRLEHRVVHPCDAEDHGGGAEPDA